MANNEKVKKTEEPKMDEMGIIPPGMKRRTVLPPVDYLLKHGDPETAHIPMSLKETFGYPFALAMVFALSLFAFHNAPWHMLPRHKPYTLPTMDRKPTFNMKDRVIPHLKKEEPKTEF